MTTALDRLRDVVAGATPGPIRAGCVNADAKPWALIGEGRFGDEMIAGHLYETDAQAIVTAMRLMRAVADPGMVERLARDLFERHTYAGYVKETRERLWSMQSRRFVSDVSRVFQLLAEEATR